ncbi:acyl-CoA Delta(11) desaturase-like [Copidosoma floridanum]|uniref:acyl-CoA Delta(11) desaturase-like n=1 Tax=Copidosoma floridanum TaxID=29053 RepID=UPI000C6F6089|nr:acyl-CoA Delta(11) desaturase-like [Copidosoma floridanum]
MHPNSGDTSVETKGETDSPKSSPAPSGAMKKRSSRWIFLRDDIRWQTTIVLAIIHVVALYGVLTFPYIQKFKTILWAYFVAMYTMFGINGGVHRYWCHKSYKAKISLRIVLAFCYLSAAQVSFKKWVLHHRLHHRYMDTEADPHNAKRGFFFSHIGWLMVDKTPEASKKQREIDLSDMQADPVIRFADKHFFVLCVLVQVFSVLIPVYCWGEDWYHGLLSQTIRYAYTLNAMFSINSVAHTYGYRPYDKSIAPVENRWASYVSFGEGWHNYHHVFPWDYRTPEIGGPRFDVVGNLITMFSWIGWAYDLKKPSDDLVRMTMRKKGDGTFLDKDVARG